MENGAKENGRGEMRGRNRKEKWEVGVKGKGRV